MTFNDLQQQILLDGFAFQRGEDSFTLVKRLLVEASIVGPSDGVAMARGPTGGMLQYLSNHDSIVSELT